MPITAKPPKARSLPKQSKQSKQSKQPKQPKQPRRPGSSARSGLSTAPTPTTLPITLSPKTSSKPPPSLNLTVDRALHIPVFLQIGERFKTAIAQGHLRPGDRVPAARALAGELHLSRGTVDAAYRLLADEGYLMTRGAAGTVVSPALPHAIEKTANMPAPVAGTPWNHAATPVVRPFQMGLPALDAFPRKLWNRLAARNLRGLGVPGLAYPDAAGYWPLRERIATYLGLSRGVVCRPEQVFITPGYRATLQLILHTLFRQKDKFWFEDPGYLNARRFLIESGAQLVPVPVDKDGLMVEHGRRLAPNARFALVTPSHQSPTGVTLSLERRMALLDWAGSGEGAGKQGSWIIEDDYDSEYRYVGRPLPALKSLDRYDRVIYTGTFSKVLFPGLKLSYMVAPASEVERFGAAANGLMAGSPQLFQASVADFMAEGHFYRHLKKMRSLYAQRRDYTAQALLNVFGDRMRIDLQAGGMHLLAMLPEGEDDALLADRALNLGLPVHALSRWCIAARPAPGLLLSFTNLTDAAHALRAVTQLKQAFDY